MRKVYFDGSEGDNKLILDSVQALKSLLLQLDVHTDLEHRVNDLYIVKSMHNMGGSQYLANGIQDVEILSKISEKVEKKEGSNWYYIRLSGQEIHV